MPTVRELKSMLDLRGVSYVGCVEKSELEELARSTAPQAQKPISAPPPEKKRDAPSSAAQPPAKKPALVTWEEALKRWAAPLTASSAASTTEQKVRWLLSDKAKAVMTSLEAAIDKRLDNWRPGKDCNCEREEKDYGRGECPCGDWDCCGECPFQEEGGGRETRAEMRERCLEYCDARNEWEDEARTAVPDKLSAWVKKVLRIVVAEANAKLHAPTKKRMLVGARAAIINLADFDDIVSGAVDELANDELDELMEPEEEEEPCACCGETDCAEKDDLVDCSYCGEVVHDDMIVGDDGEFCDRCDTVANMRCPCHRQCSYSRSQRLFECQAE